MKTFDLERFRQNLITLRGTQTQNEFAATLGINRSTLSLLESGKQKPSLDILSKVCSLGDFEPNSYFENTEEEGFLYFINALQENDKETMQSLIEKIKMKEKYEMLARRCNES